MRKVNSVYLLHGPVQMSTTWNVAVSLHLAPACPMRVLAQYAYFNGTSSKVWIQSAP